MITLSPFGPDTQKYWDKRYQLFSRFDDGIQLDREGLYYVCPEKEALDIANRCKGNTVIDAFCGAGGMAIAFARAGKNVIAIDINADRLEMARHNATIYGVADNITFINDDVISVLKEGDFDVDTICLDPPWGGPDYSQRNVLDMNDFCIDSLNMQDIVGFSNAQEVIMRLPRNFAFDTLKGSLEHYKKADGSAYFSCLFTDSKKFLNL